MYLLHEMRKFAYVYIIRKFDLLLKKGEKWIGFHDAWLMELIDSLRWKKSVERTFVNSNGAFLYKMER